MLDVDDTTVPMDPMDWNISEDYYPALGKIHGFMQLAEERKFPPIGFCSGREETALEHIACILGRPNAWSVVEGGVALRNFRTKEQLNNPNLTYKSEIVLKEIREKILSRVIPANPFFELYPSKRVNIAIELRPGSPLKIKDVYEKILEALRKFVEEGLIVISYSSIAVDVAPVGISKASGIEFLSKRMRINPAQILSIGDSRGDFSAFRLVGFVGCPSNASTECKELVAERGGRISPYPYAQGVVDIIRHFVGSP